MSQSNSLSIEIDLFGDSNTTLTAGALSKSSETTSSAIALASSFITVTSFSAGLAFLFLGFLTGVSDLIVSSLFSASDVLSFNSFFDIWQSNLYL